MTLEVQTAGDIIHRRVGQLRGQWAIIGTARGVPTGVASVVTYHYMEGRHARLDFRQNQISLRQALRPNELLQMHNEAPRRNREKPAAGTLATSAAH